jgi:cytochrome c-type biogenesis protein CcmH
MVAAAFALAMRPTDRPLTAAQRADRVAAGLRCPVCQGLSVKDSDSSTARDIRADIRRRIDAGQAPAEVRRAYVDRYGQWILLRPRSSGFDSLVWAVPAGAVAAGAVVLGAAFWRWRARGRGRPPTERERHLVAVAVARQPSVEDAR